MSKEPYSTEAILHRNIADMGVALRTQTERAESAEAELEKLRDQKPVFVAHLTQHGVAAEIIRNARRYLALRKVGVQVPGYELVKFDWSLDAAADRLLEGGE